MYRTFTLGFQVGNCTHGSGVQVKDLCRQGSGPGNKFWTSEGHSQRGEAEKEWPGRQGENQETLVSRKPRTPERLGTFLTRCVSCLLISDVSITVSRSEF